MKITNLPRWRPLRARLALVRERDCHREPRQLCARSRYDRRHRWRQVDDDDEEEEEEQKGRKSLMVQYCLESLLT